MKYDYRCEVVYVLHVYLAVDGILGGEIVASLAPADTANQLAFEFNTIFSKDSNTYPNMIPAPTAIARNCVAMPRSSFSLFGPVSNISGITPTVPT